MLALCVFLKPARSYTLQAESELEMMDWIETLQAAIGRALNNEHSADHALRGLVTKEKLDEDFMEADELVAHSRREANEAQHQLMEKIKAMPGNEICADCGAEGIFQLLYNRYQF